MLPRRLLSLALALTCLALTASCGVRPGLRIASERCYRLDYGASYPGDLSSRFATFIVLEPGTDSGSIRSGPPSRFWEMFLVGGRWQREGTALVLHFSNGSSGVRYHFAQTESDTLKGAMQVLYDVVGQSPPPAPVAAIRIQCQDARLGGPGKVAA